MTVFAGRSRQAATVHSLAADPAGEGLLLGTNRGLYRIDGDTATRIPSRAETPDGPTPVGTFLAFTADGDELLGSGHPDRRGAVAPFLGLIRSADGGKTWTTVSRYEFSDLHVIQAIHDRIYAYDAVLTAFLVSDDGGRTWEERLGVPEPFIDFVVDPDDPDRIVASSNSTIYDSGDQGRSWRALTAAESARLSWAEPDSLFRADADGLSTRATKTVRPGSSPAASTASLGSSTPPTEFSTPRCAMPPLSAQRTAAKRGARCSLHDAPAPRTPARLPASPASRSPPAATASLAARRAPSFTPRPIPAGAPAFRSSPAAGGPSTSSTPAPPAGSTGARASRSPSAAPAAPPAACAGSGSRSMTATTSSALRRGAAERRPAARGPMSSTAATATTSSTAARAPTRSPAVLVPTAPMAPRATTSCASARASPTPFAARTGTTRRCSTTGTSPASRSFSIARTGRPRPRPRMSGRPRLSAGATRQQLGRAGPRRQRRAERAGHGQGPRPAVHRRAPRAAARARHRPAQRAAPALDPEAPRRSRRTRARVRAALSRGASVSAGIWAAGSDTSGNRNGRRRV